MAFMVPVVKNEWDIYGSSPRSREQAKKASRSRTVSETSHQIVSRGPSFTRQQGSLSSSPLADGPWATARPSRSGQSRSSSRASNLSQLATSPPSRSVTFAPCVARSQPAEVPQKVPPPSAAGTSQPSSFSGFHTRVVDKMMRVLHRSEPKEVARSA